MPKSSSLRPTYIAHPSIADDAVSFATLQVDIGKILKSWKNSLFAFEWLNPDGSLKSISELGLKQRAQRDEIENSLFKQRPLSRPVLGIGMLECVEIGAGRDVLLTLAAHGVTVIDVDVPQTMVKDFQKFVAKDAERGGALIYALMAVALIAALSYAVSRSSHNGSVAHLSDSRAGILADEQIRFADEVKNAVARLQLRGCTETQLSFENNVVSGYANAGAPSDKSCHIFEPAGGAITFVTPTTDANDGSDWFFAGGPVIHQQGGYASTFVNDNADLVMLLFDVNPAVCARIDDKLGLSGIPVDGGSYGSNTKFTGSYTATDDVNGVPGASQPSPCLGAAANPNLCGMDSGCFREEDTGQRYIYYQVLLQR